MKRICCLTSSAVAKDLAPDLLDLAKVMKTVYAMELPPLSWGQWTKNEVADRSRLLTEAPGYLPEHFIKSVQLRCGSRDELRPCKVRTVGGRYYSERSR